MGFRIIFDFYSLWIGFPISLDLDGWICSVISVGSWRGFPFISDLRLLTARYHSEILGFSAGSWLDYFHYYGFPLLLDGRR